MDQFTQNYVDGFMADLIARNPGEKEFHQAVKEVLESLRVVVEANEEAIAEKWCDRLMAEYPQTHNAYACRLHLCYKQGRREEFRETMEALKRSDVVVDAQLLEWIRVFG